MWAQNLQRSYVSWQWRMMQNWKRNWLVIWKFTWGIWWILTCALESLKSFHFNVLLLSKVYIAWAKKVQRSNLSWNWRGIQNLERNWLAVSKLNCFRISQILTWVLKSLKHFHFNGLLLRKLCIVWAKKKLCVTTMKSDTKIEKKLTCLFKIDMIFTNFDPSTRKV